MPMSVLVFDIETIPDVEAGKRLYHLDGLDEANAAEAMFALRREKVGHDFLPHYLQKIVAVSLVMANRQQLKVWSLGNEQSDEKELIQRFFGGIDKHIPTLVSWNGSGFDLPVLHYRAMLHCVSAPTYWEAGETQQQFKWNNYLSRYHNRHLDLMDVLASYQSRAYAPLDEVASMLGFPGKMGMSGAKVFEQYQAGNIKSIRDYCETDVLNTYGVYLRFELMRGNLTQAEYQQSIEQMLETLREDSSRTHLIEFADAMEA